MFGQQQPEARTAIAEPRLPTSTKRNSSHMGPLFNEVDKRRLMQQQQQQQQQQFQLLESQKRSFETLGPGKPFNPKKVRFTSPKGVENLKRYANCMTADEPDSCPTACVDKRIRSQPDYQMRVDPFVQAHVTELRRNSERQIKDLKTKLQIAVTENKRLAGQNQMYSAAFPKLNRKYQEEHQKVTQLEQVVRKFAAELQRIKQQVCPIHIEFCYSCMPLIVLVCFGVTATKDGERKASPAVAHATRLLHCGQQCLNI